MEYDDKGKYFTNVISKQPLSVLIQTTRQLIRGRIHIRAGERLKDSLDLPEPFLAVTDAVVLDDSGKEIQHVEFLAVQRAQIVWVMAQEEDKAGAQ
jgi:hypothetical protein